MGKFKDWIITKLGGCTAEQYKTTDNEFWKYKYKCEDLEEEIKKMHPFAMQPIIEYVKYEPIGICASYELPCEYSGDLEYLEFAKNEIHKGIMREIIKTDSIEYKTQRDMYKMCDIMVGRINLLEKRN